MNSLCIFCLKNRTHKHANISGNTTEFLRNVSQHLETPLKVPNEDFLTRQLVSCEQCFQLVETCNFLYAQLECLKRELDKNLHNLLEAMKFASRIPTRFIKFRDQFDNQNPSEALLFGDIQNMRNELITRCNSELISNSLNVQLQGLPEKQSKPTKQEVGEESKKDVTFKMIPEWMSSIAILLLAIPLPSNVKQSNQHPEESSEVNKEQQSYIVGEQAQEMDFSDKTITQNKCKIVTRNQYSTLTRNTGESIIKCELCQLRFRSNVTLNLHNFYKHRRVKTLKVGKKQKQSNPKNFEHLRKHSKPNTSHDSTSVRNKSPIPFVLEEFLKSVGKQNVARNPSEWKYQCDFEGCGKRFTTMQNLYQHKRRHGERRFKCDWEGCKWKFFFRSTLERHKNTHIGIKPFQCRVCQREFARSEQCKLHMKSH